MSLLENLDMLLVLVAAIGSALVAGVFFAFSSFVMKALARVTPEHGISAMQAINVTVINPWFLGLFLGTGVVSLFLAIRALFLLEHEAARYVLSGSLVYLIGSIVVTIVCNIPRNERLASLPAASPGSVKAWMDYVSSWTLCNHVRTTASLAAAVLYIIAFRLWH